MESESDSAEQSPQSLLDWLGRFSNQFADLKEGVQKAIRVAEEDPEMALARARKVMEQVIREIYERRCQEPTGTRPLENLLQRLLRDGFLPARLDAYANAVRMLGNVAAHRFGEKITTNDVYRSLTNLLPILEWYCLEEKPEGKVLAAPALSPSPPELEAEKGPTKPGKRKSVALGPTPAGPQAKVESWSSTFRRFSPPPQGGTSTSLPGLEAGLLTPSQIKITVVPKGLRSFDANDANFFLDLLPGPRDQSGLPESIRFWKYRIETTSELTFTVGVIFGPSGCGKSSFVKAGLLPRLDPQVLPVYVEATAGGTEIRLLNGLRKHFPELADSTHLIGALASLRQGNGLQPGQKVVLIIDQFEQWLHVRGGEHHTELGQALRQADGEHLQAIVLVRDDFWMGLTRFMEEVQIDLLQGQNAAPVDLFDLRHARKVLRVFGQAFGVLPDTLSKDQDAFLDQAVAGLAQEGRVISVRLALFADMVKGRLWTVANLKAMGGAQGVGVTFLEDNFSSPLANPKARLHQKGAQAVLKSLLPETGSDIKGNMQSQSKLLKISGYARPKEFEELLRILDSELRLITPTETETMAPEEGIYQSTGEKYYQLTHDYLVPSLRDWLTRKQKETRRGRAEILLADRAVVWSARRENRQLPTLWQWFQIRWLTNKKNWTRPERQMMAKAARHHSTRALVVVLLLAVLGWGVYEAHGRLEAHALLDSLLRAESTKVLEIVDDMGPYRPWLDPLLRQAHQKALEKGDQAWQLKVSLALLPVDSAEVEYLYQRLLDAKVDEATVIRDALIPHKQDLLNKLWAVAESPEKGKESQRLQAAAALAKYDGKNPLWEKLSGKIAEDLVSVNPVFLGLWKEAFVPVKDHLVAPLAKIFRDRRPERTTEPYLATNLLVDYAADQPGILTELLMDADDKQFAVIFPTFKAQGQWGLLILAGEIDKKLPPDAQDEAKEQLAKRQANAAVALFKMNQPEKIWPLLTHRPDPRVRSYLIHRLAPLGTDPKILFQKFLEEKDIPTKRALLLALGDFGEKPLDREWILKVLKTYHNHPDPGLHGAAEWLLRQWKQDDQLQEIDQQLATGKVEGQRNWFVNKQGQTFAILSPKGFWMGSPPDEAGRFENETKHWRRFGRSFAIATKEVTVAQFRRCPAFKNAKYDKSYSKTPEHPINGMSWFQATEYCNWLSAQEGISKAQWVYEPIQGKYGNGMKMKPNYLKLTGFRLPTEAEWEYACRAGTTTSRFFGETEELLGKYAWYTKNSLDRWMLPMGRLQTHESNLKPNDFGLFHMLGNALEWCQDEYVYAFPVGTPDHPIIDLENQNDVEKGIFEKNSRVMRGGSFRGPRGDLRSASRGINWDHPEDHLDYYGFRVARTFIRKAE